jgi:CheY-like chemotaxis protein
MSQSATVSILLVDDDDPVREVTAAILEDLGYCVAEADTGEAALRMLERGGHIDLLMVDYSMPGMNGALLAHAVREQWPDLPVLLVTGYADKNVLEAVGEERIVLKPFRNEDLARKIRTALGAGENGKVVMLRR